MAASRRVSPLVFVGLVALIVRLTYVWVTRHDAVPFDAQWYQFAAAQLAHHGSYLDPFGFVSGFPNRPTGYFPPGFPLLLAAVDLVGGSSFGAHRVFLAGLGALTAMLICVLGTRLGGRSNGLIAGLLAAVYPPLVLADASGMSESMAVLAATSVFVVLFTPSAARGSRSGLRRWWLAGVLLAVAAVTRGDAIVVIGGVAVVVCWMTAERTERIKALIAVLLPAIIVVGLWSVRTSLALDHLVLLANNSATVVGGANCAATYHGEFLGFWLYECTTPAWPPVGPNDEAVVAGAVRHQGLTFATNDLRGALLVMPVRVARTFGLWRPFQQFRLQRAEGRRVAVQAVGWAMALAMMGVALVGWRSVPRLWRVSSATLAALVVLSSALTYGNERFRIVLEPLTLVLASWALSRLAWFRRGDETS